VRVKSKSGEREFLDADNADFWLIRADIFKFKSENHGVVKGL